MKILIIGLLVLILMYLLTRGSTKGWIAENKWKLIGGATAIGILFLVFTGKLPALAALAAPLAAFGRRIWSLRGVLTMFPQIRQILGLGAAAAGTTSAHQKAQANRDEPMTLKRASEILGVNENATIQDIRTAHRKLMGKMHPDKDGTDFLAALINEARDFLLERRQEK